MTNEEEKQNPNCNDERRTYLTSPSFYSRIQSALHLFVLSWSRFHFYSIYYFCSSYCLRNLYTICRNSWPFGKVSSVLIWFQCFLCFACFIIHVDKTNNFHVTLFPFLSHWFLHHLLPHLIDFEFFYFISLFFVDIYTNQTQSGNEMQTEWRKQMKRRRDRMNLKQKLRRRKKLNGNEMKLYMLKII